MSKQSTIVQGPMGFEMSEEIARAIEAVSKRVPKDFTYRRVGCPAAKAPLISVGPGGAHEEVSYITVDTKDRDDEVVLPAGMNSEDYNGTVTWCHIYKPKDGYDGLPVGQSLWQRQSKDRAFNGVLAKTRYATRPPNHEGKWLPDIIAHYQKMMPPMLADKSIGFVPMNVRSATHDEKAMHPDWKDAPIIDAWRLFEYAVVPIPSNPDARMVETAKSKGLWLDSLLAKQIIDPTIGQPVIPNKPSDVQPPKEMPACPKCMENRDVSEMERGGFMCRKCDLCWGGEPAKSAPEPQKPEEEMPECPRCFGKEMVSELDGPSGGFLCRKCNLCFGMREPAKTIYRPDIVQCAIERRVLQRMAAEIPKIISGRVDDELARILGRP